MFLFSSVGSVSIYLQSKAMDKLEDSVFSKLPDNVKEEVLNKVENSLFSELPDDVQKEVLKWLPVECLCMFHTVCQQWNGLFQST